MTTTPTLPLNRVRDTLDSYANINVWQLNKKRTTITFVVE